MTLYFGGRILTMVGETAQYVEAVVEKDGKIAFTGSLANAEALFPDAAKLDLEGRTMMPGHIDPHLHPSMAALILRMDFITPFDWTLPSGTYKGVRTQEEYRSRLNDLINAKAKPDQPLVTWGYHQYFHGDMSREIMDGINNTAKNAPVVVWHRSFHEVYLNTFARNQLDADKQEELKNNPQVEWDLGHFFEMGLDALMATEYFSAIVMPMMMSGYDDLVQV